MLDDAEQVPAPAGGYEPPPMDARVEGFAVPWEWFDAAGMYVAWMLASGILIAGVLGLAPDPGAPEVVAAGIITSVVLLIGVCLLWVHLRGRRTDVPGALRRVLGPAHAGPAHAGPGVGLARAAALGVGWGLLGFVVVQIGMGVVITQLISALGQEVPAIQEEVQGAVQGAGAIPLLVGVGVAVLAPLGEELLYRGVLYQALARRLPGWPAIGLSGLAFGLTHVEPFVIVLTFPLGMLLAYAMRRHGTLVVPLVAHATFNVIGVVIIRAGG